MGQGFDVLMMYMRPTTMGFKNLWTNKLTTNPQKSRKSLHGRVKSTLEFSSMLREKPTLLCYMSSLLMSAYCLKSRFGQQLHLAHYEKNKSNVISGLFSGSIAGSQFEMSYC